MRAALPALLLAAIMIGPATARDRTDRDAQRLAEALDGRVSGPSERCLSTSMSSAGEIVGRTLLYRDGGTIWRNDVPDCRQLDHDPILVVRVFAGQMCADDHFEMIDRGMRAPIGICRFGRFTPYRKPR